MKSLFISIGILIGLNSFANIDTTEFTSNVKDVTVFFNGAEIKRSGKLNLPKGKHILLINQLPGMINPQSIQVEGINGATILSVKHEVVNYNSVQKNPDIKAAEKAIEALNIKNKRLSNEVKVLQIEEDILLKNSQFTSAEKGANTQELKEATEFYRNRLNAIRNSRIDLSLLMIENNEKITLQYELINKSIAKNKRQYSKILVAIECETAISKDLNLSYYIPAAGWVPTYDFRVNETNEPLKIIYNANIYQSSGEDWNKVDITLSTNDPSLSGYKPELNRWILGKEPTYVSQNQSNQTATQLPAYGSVGTMKGIIKVSKNGEPVPFANVTLLKNEVQVLGTTTDFDGAYTLKPIQAGYYDLQISYVGFQTKRILGVQINSDKITKQDVTINEEYDPESVEIIQYNKPLIEMDKSSNVQTMKREDIQYMAVRSIDDISQVAGVGTASKDNGSGSYNVRGSRSGGSVTYIDGVKVVNNTNLPKSAFEEVEVSINNSYPDYINNPYPYSSTEYKKTKSQDIIANDLSNRIISLEYEIKIPYTILSDGKDYNLKIKETDVAVDYEYFIIPKLDKDAFLVAHLTDWEKLNLLSGKSSLYFQGKFIGESYINADQAEDTLNISLGRDKGIFVSREESKILDEKQFYSNDIKETIGWDLVVKNNKNIAVKICIEDQYPISDRKSLEVKLLNANEAQNEEKTGKLSWSFELAPQSKKELSFKYEVKYPKYLDIRVR